MAISGSANFVNKADFGISIHRPWNPDGSRSSNSEVHIKKIPPPPPGETGCCAFILQPIDGEIRGMSADKATKKQRGRPFQKGQSGNPRGKPKGLRSKMTLAIEALFEGEAEALTRKAIEKALGGDIVALRPRIAPGRGKTRLWPSPCPLWNRR